MRAVVRELPEESEHALVMKSTVPSGTGAAIRRDKPDLAYVSCPEFLREGSAIDDFMQPDRVVIGADPAPSGRPRRSRSSIGRLAASWSAPTSPRRR